MKSNKEYQGLLCIGDPHLASRVPGFRKDDYPKTILRKLIYSLDYARDNCLLPILLGDLFHRPRDNANWLLVQLMEVLQGEVLSVAGNHDCSESALSDHDSLAVLCAAKKIQLLGGDRRWGDGVWCGLINGVPVTVGGSHWKEKLPDRYDRNDHHVDGRGFVFWIVHEDMRFPGWQRLGKLDCYEIPGVNYVINGHIHKQMPEKKVGMTTWLNPGNIARLERSEDCRNHTPAILRIDVAPDGHLKRQYIQVEYAPFDAVFHEKLDSGDNEGVLDDSIFVRGLVELQSIKTTGGEGLQRFLKDNIKQFNEHVAKEIFRLAEEVISTHDSILEQDTEL